MRKGRKKHTTKACSPRGKRTSRTVVGIIDITRRGAGFLPHEAFDEDIKIDRRDTGTAMRGDEVTVLLLPSFAGERQAGKVLRVQKRARTQFVGTIEDDGTVYVQVYDSTKRFYAFAHPRTAKQAVGKRVVVHIRNWNKDPAADPIVETIDVLGTPGNHETEMSTALAKNGFAAQHTKTIEAQAEKIAAHFKADLAAELKVREDIRTIPTFTIDPTDAKDFDDAISVHPLDDTTHEIGVHIADVTHYVTPGSALDMDARERGTSVYLVDRTIPMLPEVLSNDVCSLKPNEPRLAFSVFFTVNNEQQVLKHRFAKTVIRSSRRFTYQEAQRVLDTNTGDYKNELVRMQQLAHSLRAKRVTDGALEFDTPEIGFELDEHKKPIKVFVKERLDTMKIIEDLMLLANKTVAEYIASLTKGVANTHFVYRVHGKPDYERITELALFLRAVGYDLHHQQGDVSRKSLAKLLREVKDTPHEDIVQVSTLRAMAKAVYTHKNIGHFSLGFKHYTHFTSPIRRYADVMVHRVLAAHLTNSPLSKEELQRYKTGAVLASEREVRAVEAERDSVKFKQVEYFAERTGEVFEGTVTGVTESGVFVAEKNTRAEGFVPISNMEDDWYNIDTHGYALVGERTSRAFRIGDTVAIRLLAASPEDRKIDWEILPTPLHSKL